MKRLWPLLLLLAGCPSTCVQRRDIKHAAKEQIQVEVGTASVEKANQTKKRRTVKERLRPDGTVWERETDASDEQLNSVREALSHVRLDQEKEVKNSEVIRPWWHFPGMVALSAVIGAALALLISWRFKRWKQGLPEKRR